MYTYRLFPEFLLQCYESNLHLLTITVVELRTSEDDIAM
jgi:hypothetical protein